MSMTVEEFERTRDALRLVCRRVVTSVADYERTGLRDQIEEITNSAAEATDLANRLEGWHS